MNDKASETKTIEQEKTPYEMPRIVYEGKITTRAGTPTGGLAPEPAGGADPADLFKGNR